MGVDASIVVFLYFVPAMDGFAIKAVGDLRGDSWKGTRWVAGLHYCLLMVCFRVGDFQNWSALCARGEISIV